MFSYYCSFFLIFWFVLQFSFGFFMCLHFSFICPLLSQRFSTTFIDLPKKNNDFQRFSTIFQRFSSIFHDFQRFSTIFTNFYRFGTKVPMSVPIVSTVHNLKPWQKGPNEKEGRKRSAHQCQFWRTKSRTDVGTFLCTRTAFCPDISANSGRKKRKICPGSS